MDSMCLPDFSFCDKGNGKCDCESAYYDSNGTANMGGECLPSKICSIFSYFCINNFLNNVAYGMRKIDCRSTWEKWYTRYIIYFFWTNSFSVQYTGSDYLRKQLMGTVCMRNSCIIHQQCLVCKQHQLIPFLVIRVS